MKTEELSCRDLLKWGGVAVASFSLGTLESIISGSRGASVQPDEPDAKQKAAASDACLKATHATRDTRNNADKIYESESLSLSVNVTGSAMVNDIS